MPPSAIPLDAILQPAVLYDAGGRIVAVNDLAESLAGRPLAGLSAADLAGIFDVRSPNGLPFMDAGPTLSRALAGEKVADLPLAVTLPDGRTLEILATASPIRDGDAVTGVLVLWQDVTASVTAERALRESKQKYRALIDASPHIVLLLDAAGTVLAMLRRPVAELVGASIWEVMPPGVVEFRRERFDEVLRSGESSRFEEVQDGRWFETVVEPIASGAGEVSRVAVISREITDWRQAEETLRDSRARYWDLIETNADFVWETDAEGRYTYCSPQMERLWGIRPEEMIGRTPFERMPPADRERALAAFDEIGRAPSGFSGLETTSYDARGNPITLEISGIPFFGDDGALIGYRGVTRDITERKRAEETLRLSEERLRLAQEGAGIAIWDRDTKTDRVTVAPGFMRRYLLDPELMKTYADWERFIHPADRERVETGRRAALVAGEPLDLEFRIVIPSGEIRWIQLRAQGLADAPGALSRVVGVIIDVTERHRAEEALAESEADARSFFENMVDACAICETVVNDRGEPVDIRLVGVNPALERALSLPADLIIGQTAFMILPTLHREWLDLFIEVSRNRTFVAVEEPFPALGRRYHVTGFPVRHGRVAVVFRDITAERGV